MKTKVIILFLCLIQQLVFSDEICSCTEDGGFIPVGPPIELEKTAAALSINEINSSSIVIEMEGMAGYEYHFSFSNDLASWTATGATIKINNVTEITENTADVHFFATEEECIITVQFEDTRPDSAFFRCFTYGSYRLP
ncbi:hypothetical protein QEH52_19525 [Coraliomargarita sp. SDUM461003]|uniref:Uncharacterized protein n=1 Tax=Thalassobacterium maritimum TaxID=3041265 RepID=A0ABU1B003_9BACT|nr:hypothetical protein [Coraliomargarita sp. SDUM461003]MDQ8209718.1 hypothetical protein [Coraliomargarita sp. SDUM461003]